MTDSPFTLRFAVECPNCKASYLLTNEAIGRTAKCRCGHRFSVTGPLYASVPADRSCLSVCTHCNARLVASHDAPGSQVLCCFCGKTFRQAPASSPQHTQRGGQPQACISSASLPPAPLSHGPDNIETEVRSIVAEWSRPAPESGIRKKQALVSWGSSVTTAGPQPETTSASVATAYLVGLWTVFQCPNCRQHSALVAREKKSSLKCAACSEQILLKHGTACDVQKQLGDPTFWMQCFCPQCNARISVDNSFRDKMIFCPICSGSFRAPLGEPALPRPPVHQSPSPAAYTYRPLAVRSYRKKNGTWVQSYRRSRPRKQW